MLRSLEVYVVINVIVTSEDYSEFEFEITDFRKMLYDLEITVLVKSKKYFIQV